ncbi:hypothetical protein E2C01_041262 [Portunus trituberculatus]|uniref:Uncharacterized protein n=1 Tax=Portunus trituberculatus TaxID=210409 RepID=A0A5B7FR85_PORTR|nr:hypothetical protein [Portunus trituberculatus]
MAFSINRECLAVGCVMRAAAPSTRMAMTAEHHFQDVNTELIRAVKPCKQSRCPRRSYSRVLITALKLAVTWLRAAILHRNPNIIYRPSLTFRRPSDSAWIILSCQTIGTLSSTALS